MKEGIRKRMCPVICAMALACAGCAPQSGILESEKAYAVQLVSVYDGSELDILDEKLREYLGLTDGNEQAEFLSSHVGSNYDYQNYYLRWRGNGSEEYTLLIADDASFENALTVSTPRTQARIGLLTPGTKYFWKVIDSNGGESATDTFATKDAPCRIVDVEGAYNVRDIGGWSTEEGKRVKYGLIYRGGKLNARSEGDESISDAGRAAMRDVLGIRTELDFRSSGDNGGQSESALGGDILYVRASLPQYSQIVPEGGRSDSGRYNGATPSALKKIFDVLSEKSNYPLYYHCNAGADRTGTVTFLLNGLLGVSYEDLTRDFELTSFSKYGRRWRSDISEGKFTADGIMQDDSDNFVAWGEMYRLIVENYATEENTLSSAIENYLISVAGCTKEQLQTIREIMLED